MGQSYAVARPAEDLVGWERALVAFLVEKERRSGSRRTVEGYSRMLQAFFGRVGKTPDELTSQDVFVWAHSPGASGKDPSPTTTAARIACVSSFFRFLIRMEIVSTNPCDRLERPKLAQSTPRGLSAEEIRRLLAVLPDTSVGLRNRAIILFLVLTGRRREEVFRLTAGDLSLDSAVPYYQYRGKGGKSGRRELPRPAYDALRTALRGFGRELEEMAPEESLWPTEARTAVRSSTFYASLQGYLRKAGLPRAGVHIFRHSAAKLRRDAGQSIEEVSRFLDHSSLAVTTTYLRRLEGQEDPGWQKVAEAISLEETASTGLAPASRSEPSIKE